MNYKTGYDALKGILTENLRIISMGETRLGWFKHSSSYQHSPSLTLRSLGPESHHTETT